MPSEKTQVIELIFSDQKRWQGNKLVNPDVTFDEVKEAIAKLKLLDESKKISLSESNPANFFKDLMRKHGSLMNNWPDAVRAAGFYGEQAKGKRLCFRFIEYDESTHGQIPPPPYPALSLKIYHAQTLSVNPLNKVLARNDENWLMSISTSISIPQIHFTLHDTSGWQPASLNHVQFNMKLRGAEIDGVFLLEDQGGKIGIVCVEAKGISDDIIESQILDQIKAAQKVDGFKRLGKKYFSDQSGLYIIPAALKLYRKEKFPVAHPEIDLLESGQSILYFIHYAPVSMESEIVGLSEPVGQTAFLLKPSIAGL